MFVCVMPSDSKHVLEQEAARLKKEKKRTSTIDLVLSYTASQVDLASEAIEEVFSRKKVSSISATAPINRPAVPCRPEQPIVDLEDSANGRETRRQRAKKLDKTQGFMKYKRLNEAYRPARKRVKDWKEISARLSENELKYQSARLRCAFLPSDTGCPISDVIPKWNDLVFKINGAMH